MFGKPFNLDENKQKEILNYYEAKIGIAETDFAERNDEKIPEWWSRYRNTWSSKTDKNSPWPGSADFCHPFVAWASSSTESRLLSAVKTGGNICKIMAPYTVAARPAAEKLNRYINGVFKKKLEPSRELREWIQRIVAEGTAILMPMYERVVRPLVKYVKDKVGYAFNETRPEDALGTAKKELKTQKNEKAIYEGLNFRVWPISMLLYPPEAKNFQDCEWVALKNFMDKFTLLAEARKNKWINTDKIRSFDNKTKGPEYEDKNETGGTQATSENTQLAKIYIVYGYYDVDGCGNAENCVFVFDFDDKALLYAGENQSFWGVRPLTATQCFFVSGKIAGQGYPERLSLVHDELTTIHNIIIDNAAKRNGFGGMFIPNKMVGTKVESLNLTPTSMVPVQSLDAMKFFDIEGVDPALPALEAATLGMGERLAIVNDVSLGREVKIERPTFRGKLLTAQQYAENLDIILQNVREGLEETIWQMIYLLYQYMPVEGLEYDVLDDNGNPVYEPSRVMQGYQVQKRERLMREDLEYIEDFEVIVMVQAINAVSGLAEQKALMAMQTFGADQTGEIDTSIIKKNALQVMYPDLAKVAIRGPKEFQQMQGAFDLLKQKEAALNSKQEMLNKASGESPTDLVPPNMEGEMPAATGEPQTPQTSTEGF